jgi:hypothetical protein
MSGVQPIAVVENASEVCRFMSLLLLEKHAQSNIPDGRHAHVEDAIAQTRG